jgi:cardiolipin synthase
VGRGSLDRRGDEAHPRVDRGRLTFRRLTGLDRSGPPPPETAAGQPLRPWTIPNAIGFVRLALLPVLIVLAFSSGDGRSTAAAIVFALIGWGDVADGMTARVTRQYSRLGALMDPLIDRLLVVSGVAVCFYFDLLPRWALAVLVGREVFMVAVARPALRRGVELKINWPGRAAVWPTMSALFCALAGLSVVAEILLYVGLALTLLATALYVRDGTRQARRARKSAPTPSSSA